MDAKSHSDDAFLRSVTFPEEDRHLFTTAPWQGGYRWFRSPNVIPLERWKQRRQRRIQPDEPDKAA
jgi:hypothetical protein